MSWSESQLLTVNPIAWTRESSLPYTAQVLTDLGPSFLGDLTLRLTSLGAISRKLQDILSASPTPQDFGGVCDGTSRPVSQWLTGGARDRGYASLAAITADYPHVTSATDEIDWAACQQSILRHNMLAPNGTPVINKPLVLSGGPITVVGARTPRLIQKTANTPIFEVQDLTVGHSIYGVNGAYETVQSSSNTNANLVSIRVDTTVTEKTIEQLLVSDVGLNDGYGIIGASSLNSGANPVNLSRLIARNIVSENCCRLIDWTSNSKSGYVTRSYMQFLQAYSPRAGASAYIIDLANISRVVIIGLSADRLHDDGRLLRCGSGIGLNIQELAVVNLKVTNTTPLISITAGGAKLSSVYVNLGFTTDATFAPGVSAIWPMIEIIGQPGVIEHLVFKADQPSKLINGTLTLVKSELGSEIYGINLDLLYDAHSNATGSQVVPIESTNHSETARLSSAPVLTKRKVKNSDASLLSFPLNLTRWDLVRENAYVFASNFSGTVTINLPDNAFIEETKFTIISTHTSTDGFVDVRAGGTSLAIVGAQTTRVFTYSQSVNRKWYFESDPDYLLETPADIEATAALIFGQESSLPTESVAANISYMRALGVGGASVKSTPTVAMAALLATSAPNSLATNTALAKILGVTAGGASAGRELDDFAGDLLATSGVPLTLRRFVTPLEYGASNDGTTNDATAITNAAAAAAAAGLPLVLSGQYAIGSTIDLTAVKNVVSHNAIIKPSFDGVAVQWLGPDGGTTESNHCTGMLTVYWETRDWTKSRTAFYIQNAYSGIFYLRALQATIGIHLHGKNSGCVHNAFYFDAIWQCNMGLYATCENSGGWVNSNKFYGGFFYGAASVTGSLFESTAGHIVITSSPYQNNGNVFYSPSLEWTGAGFRLFRMGGTRNWIRPGYCELNSGDTTWAVDSGEQNTIICDSVPYLVGYDPEISGAANRLDASTAVEPTIYGPQGYRHSGGVGTQHFASDSSSRPTVTVKNDDPAGVNIKLTSGGGVDFFGVTTGASRSSHVMDDYQRGEFTPTVSGSSTAGTATYDRRLGRFTKIGTQVHVTITLQWSGHTGSGDFLLTGLPFTSENNSENISVLAVHALGISTSGNIRAVILPNNASVTMYDILNAGTGALMTLPTSGTLVLAGHYEAA